MIAWLYSIIIGIIDKLIWLPGLFSNKVKIGNTGRQQSFDLLANSINVSDQVIWMHVASLGEFEQGRPVIEALKKSHSNYKILLSFFSPSGYELRKNYEHADVVCYLPLDTKANASRFVELVHPDLCIFVKYELWPNYLNAIRDREIPALLISTVVNTDNGLYKWTEKWLSEMLNSFDYILTQDQQSLELIKSLKYTGQLLVAGDTRIDRTSAIAHDIEEIPLIQKFCANKKVLIAGSTWDQDEKIIADLISSGRLENWQIIIAPHDIAEKRIQSVIRQFGGIRFSQLKSEKTNEQVLIIDNIGLLNQIYQYANLAYIGGGFGKGIHNTLEPAAFGIPIVFGPKYHKFVEAQALVSSGGAKSVKNADELIAFFEEMLDDRYYQSAQKAVRGFIANNKGATSKVMQVIKSYLSA